MALINFDEAAWGAVEGIELCDHGAPGNTLSDPATGVSFIIGEGAMEVLSSDGNRFLYFSCVDCADVVHETTTLVIRFDTAQQYVRFRIYPDPVGAAIMTVNYYREHGAVDLLDSRSVPIEFLTPAQVIYSSSSPVRELTIRTEAAENRFYEIEFYESLAEIRHDISLVLDGSGSMSAQNKWGVMIEAADIFHDLYTAFGNTVDGFGAMRFRWDCGDALAGNQTVAQPPLNPLSVAVDLPTLYAADGPDNCTPIGEAVIQGAAQVAGGDNQAKHLLLLTDGKNNRGRSVAVASADSALDGLTVHTLGLGSGGNIDPVEITDLATAHGGLFRQTTDASEVLDFFAESLGDMLGKVETADIIDDSATLAPGTTKAVFLIAWSDPALTHDFDLITPGGDVVDHAALPALPGITLTYYPQSPGGSHAYFVVEGGITGEWRFHNTPAAVQRIVLEDLDLTIQWTLTPQLGLTGKPITIEARVSYQGAAYKGSVSVSATVTRPDESQGHLVASEQQKQPVAPKPVGDTSHRREIIATVLGRRERHDFLFKSLPPVAFAVSSDGVFKMQYTDTQFDGVYRFDLQAEGRGADGKRVFARRATRFCTLVAAIDGGQTTTQVESLGKSLFRVSITPMTASGTFVGPFLGDQLTVASPHGTRVGTLQDNLDGTYSQLMRTAGQTPREFAIGILNQTVPVNGPGVVSNRLLWLALFLLLVLLILSLLF